MSTIQLNRDTPLDAIDPAWAWQPWTPSAEEPWDRRRAALFFRRAGFGASALEVDLALKGSFGELVDRVFDKQKSTEFEEQSAAIAKSVLATGDAQQLARWWLHRMLYSPDVLREKLTLFWHGHFATGAEKVLDTELMFQQNELLRKFALGDFRELVQSISKDPAMLIYLDSVTNRKAHANENYARELMELFCLGEGNYTEADVQQLARCFTGWEIRRKQFRFNSYQHDEGTKSILGRNSIESGEEAIDHILQQPSMAHFICSKLFRFFVCDEPLPPNQLLEPLAERFRSDKLNLEGLVRTIVSSRLMMSNWSVGRKIRSPVELVIGFLRTLEASTGLDRIVERLREIGQGLFFPPNVKGWDGGRAWINSSTLVGRANVIHFLVHHETTRYAGGSLSNFVSRFGGQDAEKFLVSLDELFLARTLQESQRTSILQKSAALKGDAKYRETLSLFATLPIVQLS